MEIDNKKKEELIDFLTDILFDRFKSAVKNYLRSGLFPINYAKCVRPCPSTILPDKKAKIKPGSLVVLDMKVESWPVKIGIVDTIFSVYNYSIGSTGRCYRLVAEGYGDSFKPNSYGEGPIYAKEEDLEYIEEKI